MYAYIVHVFNESYGRRPSPFLVSHAELWQAYYSRYEIDCELSKKFTPVKTLADTVLGNSMWL